MNKIKLIALDIDETILPKNNIISDRVKKTVEEAQKRGIKVLIATGRMHKSAMPVAKNLNLTSPIISYQGAMIKNFYGNEDLIFHCPLKEEHAQKVISLLKDDDVQLNIYMDDNLYSQTETERLQQYSAKQNIKYIITDSFDKFPKFEPTKMLAIGKDSEHTDYIIKKLKDCFNDELYLVKSSPVFCEINNKQTSKGNAIKYLANLWGIKPEETMAIGDQNNDIEMLKSVHIKVAMGNATDDLKHVANFITQDIDHDGAAEAIEKFALNNEELTCTK